MTKKETIYLTCPRERSQPSKNLLYCLANCTERCHAFFELDDKKILAVIREDDGKHELKYDQLKLFPLKEKKRTQPS